MSPIPADAAGLSAFDPVLWGLLAAAFLVRACRALALRFGPWMRRRLVPDGKDLVSPFDGTFALLAFALSTLLAAVALWGAAIGAARGQIGSLLAAPPALFVLFPWALVRLLLVPLGSVKAAYWAGWLCEGAFRSDGAGGPVLAAAWAAARGRDVGEATIAWVEARLGEALPLRGAGVVAAGLVCAARGDRAGARTLLESSLELSHLPAAASRVASDYLSALAAEEGRWADLAERPGGLRAALARSRAAWFLMESAKRLTRRPGALSDGALSLLWLLAPRRLETRPLLKRALAAPVGAVFDGTERPERPAAEPTGDALSDALSAQARLWGEEAKATAADLAELGAAWDRALADAGLEQRVLVRSLELGALEGARLRQQLGEQAASELARLSIDRGVELASIAPRGPTLDRAARRVRDELLAPVEAACSAMRRRAVEQRPLPPIDEWREFLALRDRYRLCARLGGAEGRRLAWPRVRDDACKLAVWLWNIRGERAIGNAMFRWLLAEAVELSDEPTIELQRKNVACGD